MRTSGACFAVVALEYAAPGTRRVLRDAGCSYLDAAGHCYLKASPGSVAPRLETDTATWVANAAVGAILGGTVPRAARLMQSAVNDATELHSGEAPTIDVLAHPVELLEWLVGDATARSLHPGAKAYLYASDPDDLLAKLPYHPRPQDEAAPAGLSIEGSTLLCCVQLKFANNNAENHLVEVNHGGGRLAILGTDDGRASAC
jgi:hypothetical protein